MTKSKARRPTKPLKKAGKPDSQGDTAANFAAVVALDENLLKARLSAARLALAHPGEKGRSLEAYVVDLVRQMLPVEYGVSTGFIAHLVKDGVEMSKQ